MSSWHALKKGKSNEFVPVSPGIQKVENKPDQVVDLAIKQQMSVGHSSAKAHQVPQQSRRAVRRLREFWTQTESSPHANASCQTEELRKIEKKKKKKGLRVSAVETKPFLPPAPPPKPKAVFADAESMKRNARNALIRPQRTVFDLYKKKGWFQAIAKSRVFDNVTFLFIFVNAGWLAVDADYNNALLLVDADPQFIIMENIFCTYFVFEVVVRWMAFKWKRDCYKDPWFIFDCVLVLLMVAETWLLSLYILLIDSSGSPNLGGGLSVVRVIRVVKMLRVSRMARLLRAIPEVIILVRGVGAASRSVSVFCILWTGLIYVFAIVFKTFTEGEDTGKMNFDTVWVSANTLLLNGVFPMHAELVNDVSEAHWALWIVMMIFVLLAAVTLLNMLVGVMVEIIAVIATTEKEGLVILTVATALRECMAKTGRECSKEFTRNEFIDFILEPCVIQVAQDNGVDIIALGDTADVLFEDLEKNGSEMDFESFVNTFLNMRGTNQATVKDVKEQMRTMKGIVKDALSLTVESIKEEFTMLREEMFEREKERAAQQRAILHAMDDRDSGSEEEDSEE